MQTTVTLVRHRSGFANVSDSFAVYEPDAWYDEYTEEPATYDLPDGYSVAKDKRGEMQIYDQRGCHCEIEMHMTTGRPMLNSIAKGGIDFQQRVLRRATHEAA